MAFMRQIFGGRKESLAVGWSVRSRRHDLTAPATTTIFGPGGYRDAAAAGLVSRGVGILTLALLLLALAAAATTQACRDAVQRACLRMRGAPRMKGGRREPEALLGDEPPWTWMM